MQTGNLLYFVITAKSIIFLSSSIFMCKSISTGGNGLEIIDLESTVDLNMYLLNENINSVGKCK